MAAILGDTPYNQGSPGFRHGTDTDTQTQRTEGHCG